MWEYYNDKYILLTGGSGFLGTAIVHRLLSKTRPRRIYLLCRGGESRLIRRWGKSLGESEVAWLFHFNILTVLDGDIQLPCLGLQAGAQADLRKNVNIVVHAASTINLKDSLAKVQETIIAPSVSLARFALSFERLDRFVYISTAFANTHLYKATETPETEVEETIYPLLGEEKLVANTLASAEDAMIEISQYGSSAEYRMHDFPWPYAYAKHLTERLILNLFTDAGEAAKVLIIRPSVIGPAERYPMPGYAVPLSTPSTALAAAMIVTPTFRVLVPSRCVNPLEQATIDEVPVDVVVDRLLAHLAHNTTGCVHAVGGKRGRLKFGQFWTAVMALRRLPWALKIVWSSTLDWHSPKLHPVLRLYVILGTAFLFRETKTEELWRRLHPEQQQDFALFKQATPDSYDLLSRRDHIRYLIRLFARKTIWPAWLLLSLCR